jgi:uroporphyrinogen-III synthase
MAASALAGRRVVVTQAAHQAPEFAAQLTARGAEPLLYPCIAIAPPADPAALDAALHDAVAGRFAWLVLTSANTVTAIRQRLAGLMLDAAGLDATAIAAIGPATAGAIREQFGREAELLAGEHQAEGLIAALAPVIQPGQRLLVPQADIARPVLVQELAGCGADVVSIAAYRTVIGHGGVDLPALLAEKRVDAVTFTSSSTVRNLVARLHAEGGLLRQMDDICIACIGPVTAATAGEFGLPATVVAQKQSVEGLVEALEGYWSQHA